MCSSLYLKKKMLSALCSLGLSVNRFTEGGNFSTVLYQTEDFLQLYRFAQWDDFNQKIITYLILLINALFSVNFLKVLKAVIIIQNSHKIIVNVGTLAKLGSVKRLCKVIHPCFTKFCR